MRQPGSPDPSRTTSSPSAKMVGAFLILSLLALTCAGACSCMISAFAGKFVDEREEGDRRYTELTRLEEQDGLLNEGEGVTEEGKAFIPRVKVVTKRPAHAYLSACASACCLGSLLAVLGFLGAVLFFYPQSPSYSVCTTTCESHSLCLIFSAFLFATFGERI